MSRYSLMAQDRNLLLTGYVEPNRPRLGRQVAEKLGLRFVDIEEMMEERFGDSLENARARYGERRIKTMEDEIVQDAALYRHALIRVNGSTLVRSEDAPRLMATGATICLVARLDAILQRMHLMMGARFHDPAGREAEIGALRREWAVRKLPNILEYDATYKEEATIVADLVALWQSIAIQRG
jgi:shikimate kinase